MSETQRAADRTASPNSPAAGQSGTGMFDMAARWHAEMLRFCTLRMGRYFELSSRVWECRTANDVMRLHTGFLEKMLSDYQSETDLICRQLLEVQESAANAQRIRPPSYEAAILNAQRDAARIIDLAKDQAARIVEEARERSSPKTETPPAKREARKNTG
jgi:hypothetical protein